MSTIAFLGLGAMGLPMAKRLCQAGHRLRVATHRNSGPADELVALGAVKLGSFDQAASGAEYVLSILPDDRQMEATLLNPQFMRALNPSAALIEMTSSSSAMMRRIADEYGTIGVRCFDAPVSGGVAGATNGTLTIMGGGEATLLEKIRPVLEAMAKKIFHVGEVGSGKAVKALNQLLAASNMVIAAEVLALAKSLGVDLDLMYDVVSASSGGSYIFNNKFKKMAAGDFSSGFKSNLMRKDMRIGLAEAGEMSLPMSTLAYQMYQLLGKECGDLDFSVVSRVFEKP